MPRKKKLVDLGKNIRRPLLSNPNHFLQEIAEQYPIEFTRAVDTFIMENLKEKPLKIEVIKDGKSIMSANLLWISLEDDGSVMMYLDNKKYLYPKPENVRSALFMPIGKSARGYVEITVNTRLPVCVLCNNPIEIFDDSTRCPRCGAISHRVHLEEWIRMKGSCSVCNSPLSISEEGEIIAV
ncbi:MAG: hypothetical protein ACTSWN_05295 [Promethearchaeota archaeon]